jgi:feruloyl esterase
MRLFLSPGMGHCGGGPGLDNFDPLAAIEAWVERGQAPERLVARGAAFPGVERPLCAFPASAVYDGSGAPQLAASFRCELPRGEQP